MDIGIMVSMSYIIKPATTAPQDNTFEAAEQRRAVLLTLVLDGPTGRREYQVTADDAWTFDNDAYDHAAGTCEDPQDADFAYYIAR
jgi:hypothetical protein